MSINFTLNGGPYDMPEGSRITDLVNELELGTLPLTIKVNGKRLMLRKDWQQEIQPDDRVEIGQSIPHSCVTIEV